MARRITEVTRRDIREALSSLNLSGRLDETAFLSRLYDLDRLPSYDSRFQTAREDIVKHRLANDDWPGPNYEDGRYVLSLRHMSPLKRAVLCMSPIWNQSLRSDPGIGRIGIGCHAAPVRPRGDTEHRRRECHDTEVLR